MFPQDMIKQYLAYRQNYLLWPTLTVSCWLKANFRERDARCDWPWRLDIDDLWLISMAYVFILATSALAAAGATSYIRKQQSERGIRSETGISVAVVQTKEKKESRRNRQKCLARSSRTMPISPTISARWPNCRYSNWRLFRLPLSAAVIVVVVSWSSSLRRHHRRDSILSIPYL